VRRLGHTTLCFLPILFPAHSDLAVQ
jgi:hypothetical protein